MLSARLYAKLIESEIKCLSVPAADTMNYN